MNLLIALRAARGWTDRDDLRRSIADYADLDDTAFDRQFSRDKAALEAMGMAISTTSWDDPFTDGTGYGYRIDDAGYALTQIDFTPEEAAVVSVTQSLLADTALESDARSALNKLRGLGEGFALDPADDSGSRTPDAPFAAVPAHIAGTVFAGLLRAVEARRAVAFDYRRPGAQTSRRTLEPYALLTRGDRSYVVGRDVDRDAVRTFRLTRIQGRLRSAPRRRDGDYGVPDGFDAAAHTTLDGALAPHDEDARNPAVDVVLAVAPGRAVPLRESAHDAVPTVPAEAPTIPPGWDVLGLRTNDQSAFADGLLEYSPSVLVLAPDSLAQHHVACLTRTADSLDALVGQPPETTVGEAGGDHA
ncbi:helix-turn-helix transcriptional regulator [Brevibacterium jeotgali]|uniref:Proteasome accessory factor B n=1 Tax=Brevibacterium jeotgali TaxID=1262550 RepID=A0A2H1L1R9_9MICO|nr:WYL domain-containing protein [Brevibacterium jeotgali]SMY10851.1 proteasome accessory factor B [Brevibacterium jeotgali]